jgi:hypothetical protein
MLTIDPGALRSSRCRTSACISRNGPRALMSNCCCHISSVVSCNVPRAVVAAEFSSALTVPSRAIASTISREQSSAWPTLACT